MSNLCIIPARGGSKRIPRKNIKDFLGKPIIAYSIEAAIKSNLFDEIMVSTDDEEIAAIAKKYGAKVPFMRSEQNADDFATLADVIEEVVKSYHNNINKEFRYICCILPTAPLLQIRHLKSSFEQMLTQKADSITPVVRFSYPIQRALRLVNDKIEMFYPEYKKTRSQDLDSAFYDAGQFYWKTSSSILNICEKKIGYELAEIEVQDIDTEQDWEMAKLKYKLLK